MKFPPLIQGVLPLNELHITTIQVLERSRIRSDHHPKTEVSLSSKSRIKSTLFFKKLVAQREMTSAIKFTSFITKKHLSEHDILSKGPHLYKKILKIRNMTKFQLSKVSRIWKVVLL